MECPFCVKYIPALDAMTTKIKLDKRSRFALRDNHGNVYIFRVSTKHDKQALKLVEDYFNSQLPGDEYICKLGKKDKQLALLYLIRDIYTSLESNKLTIYRRKVKNFFDYDLLV